MTFFDLAKVPLSRRGAYLAVSRTYANDPGYRNHPNHLYLRSVRGGAAHKWGGLLRLAPLAADGSPAAFTETAAPAGATLEGPGGGRVEMSFDETGGLRIRGAACAFRLDWEGCTAGGIAHRWGDSRVLVIQPQLHTQLSITRVRGVMEPEVRWQTQGTRHHTAEFHTLVSGGDDGRWEITIAELHCGLPAPADREGVSAAAEFGEFFARYEHLVRPEYREAAELAAYVNWSAIVAPSGNFKRPAMLMSKNWMHNLWTWDNCFNALALANADPELALDQLRIAFDHQDERGSLPDAVTDNHITRDFVKPPVYGWFLSRMLEANPALDTPAVRDEFAGKLRKLSGWWDARKPAPSSHPAYLHGNDSGWDNCTLFDGGYPVESPDLMAFLAEQEFFLARCGMPDNGAERVAALVSDFWDARAGRFNTRNSATHTPAETPRSLLSFIPLILGMRLPAEIRAKMVADLNVEGDLLTPYGFATESLRGPCFHDTGYWRGPLWAPVNFLVIEGLRACGERAFADDVARRFCDTCARSGFAENFSALDGRGLCDSAYTWASSVFLLLAMK